MSRPKVFDVFPLGYETDVLLLRLQTLADVVDEFCIVEGDRWYTGAERESLWPRLMDYPEFSRFEPRVHWRGVELPEHPYVDPEDMGSPYSGPAWQREYVLRGEMLPLVDDAGARPDDIVIISDADEIPNPLAIRNYVEQATRTREFTTFGQPGTFERPMGAPVNRLAGHYYQLRLDLRAEGSMEGAMRSFPQLAGHLWEFRQPLIGRRDAFTHAQQDRAAMQAKVRTDRNHPGWHFSCMGSNADIAHKLRSYSHDELSNITADDVAGYIEHREAIGHHVPLRQVSLQELPDPVRKDPQAWRHMLAQEFVSGVQRG